MVDFSSSFEEYLRLFKGISNPNDLKPEERARLYSDNVDRFNTWESIPVILRNRYGSSIPADVWEAAKLGDYETLKEMAEHPEIKQVEDARTKVEEEKFGSSSDGKNAPSDITSDIAAATFIAAVAIGYSHEASHQLALSSQIRDELRQKAADRPLTAEEHKQWIDTRQKDISTIRKEWAENQPEKLLMHMLAKYNGGKLSQEDKDKFPQTVEDLMQKITSPDNNRMTELLNYIKTPRMQARIARFNDETLEILSHTVLQKVPQSQKQDYLARSDIKAKMVSDSINRGASNLPEKQNVTAKERYANMPSALNRGTRGNRER